MVFRKSLYRNRYNLCTVLLLFFCLKTAAGYGSCHNGAGICVPKEQCRNGALIITDQPLLIDRMLRTGDEDACNQFGMQCCPLPETDPVDSEEQESVTATTTEETEDDMGWNAQCGQRTNVTEIGNENEETSRFEFPWSVALFSVKIVYGKERKQFLCGGTLIDDYLVLTAARCVTNQNPSSLVVQLGRWNLDEKQEPWTQEIAIEELIIHRNYTASSNLRNIAILYLSDPVNMGRAANRVCLPEQNVPFDADSLCYVVGWTNTFRLDDTRRQLKIRSTFTTREECTSTIRRATRKSSFQLPNDNICPQYLDDPLPCERAPGSGMVCESSTTPGQFFLVGIASYSVRECDKYRAHDVFVKTTEYMGWIDDIARGKNREPSYYRPDPAVEQF